MDRLAADLVLGKELGVSVRGQLRKCRGSPELIIKIIARPRLVRDDIWQRLDCSSTHHIWDTVLDGVDVATSAADHLALLDVDLKVSYRAVNE